MDLTTKFVSIFLLILLLGGLIIMSAFAIKEDTSYVKTKAKNSLIIEYYKDTRTNLCYANVRTTNYRTTSTILVPCDSVSNFLSKND